MARKRREYMTSIDYVVIALSPALIMTLVGSLCFFLLEVFYRGQYEARLTWIMFWFVFAIVLIARISMEEGAEKATVYGLALAGAVGVAMLRFVDSPFIAWGLMGLTWWCANKLTWDCTLVDDDQDASGEGLLQIAGLDDSLGSTGEPDMATGEPEASASVSATTSASGNRGADGARSPSGSAKGFWQRLLESPEERRRRPHAPGLWVVYFSLAALPLFGLGQAFIPAGDVLRRRYAFLLLAVYVASGLGLLLTTSFLGLRRYLRQRRLQMPLAMTSVWLTVGAVLIVGLLLAAQIIPRPHPEYPVEELIAGALGSRQREASRYAILKDSATKGQSASGGQQNSQQGQQGQGQQSAERGAGSGEQKQSQQGQGQQGQGQQGQGQQGQGQQGQGQQGQGKQGQGQQSAERGAGSAEQKQSQQGQGQQGQRQQGQGQQGQGQQGQGQQGQGQQGQGQQGQGQQGQGQQGQQSGERGTRNAEQNQAQQGQGSQGQGQAAEKSSGQPKPAETQANQAQPEPPAPSRLPDLTSMPMASWIRWLMYAAMLAAAIYGFSKYRQQVMAFLRQLLEELKNILNGLFGRRQAAASEAAAAEPPPRPFAAFKDPFLTGAASRTSPEQLVRYSFDALQAWAFERGSPRRPDATALEFSQQLAGQAPQIAAEARELAQLYSQITYARGQLTPQCLPTLKRLWEQLRLASRPARVSAP